MGQDGLVIMFAYWVGIKYLANLFSPLPRLVSQRYEELMVGNEIYARRKVLAGIVLTFGNDIKTAKVISVTTGTKCISGEYISVNGLAVNDSHAEIVARRCFINFLYDQLELHAKPDTAKDSIFLKPTEKDGLYKLKDNIQIHLYINTAPCGDARVFSPHENDQALDKHPNRKARGQLRTKVESGEGTIPVKNCDGIQTWDGVLQVIYSSVFPVFGILSLISGTTFAHHVLLG